MIYIVTPHTMSNIAMKHLHIVKQGTTASNANYSVPVSSSICRSVLGASGMRRVASLDT